MSAIEHPGQRRSKRQKTDVACERCRARKSACDGARPVCWQCNLAGVECSYRTTSAADEIILTIECRVSSLEHRVTQLEEFPNSLSSHEQDRQILDQQPPPLPIVHTGAAHRLLHSWPRLGVKFTLPDVHPLTYLHEVEQAAVLDALHLRKIPQELSPLALEPLNSVYETTSFAWSSLEPFFAEEIHQVSKAHDINSNPRTWSCEKLGAVALLHLSHGNSEPAREYAGAMLAQLWTVYELPQSRRFPVLLLTAYLLTTVLHCPFKALGILQTAKLPSTSAAQAVDQHLLALAYLLESDLLTELNGADTGHYELDAGDWMPQIISSSSALTAPKLSCIGHLLLRYEIDLRSFHNSILAELYPMSQAYRRPAEIGSVVTRLQKDLEAWYRNLPLDDQFVRTFGLLQTQEGPSKHRDMALRYHACKFFLNRPVLYSVTHEDLEDAVTSPNGTVITVGKRNMPAWVFEACHKCLESGAFVVSLLTMSETQMIAWPDLQLLLACALIMIHARYSTRTAQMVSDLPQIVEMLEGIPLFLDKLHSTAHTTKVRAIVQNIFLNHQQPESRP